MSSRSNPEIELPRKAGSADISADIKNHKFNPEFHPPPCTTRQRTPASSSTSSLPPVDAKDSATRKRHDSSEESQQQGSFLTEVPAKKFDQFLTEARKNSIGGNRKYSTEKRKDSVRRASDIGDKAIRILNPRIAQREKEAFDEKYNAKNFRKNSIKMEEEMAKWRAEQIEQVKRHQIREGYDLSIRKKSGGANRLMEGYVEGDIRRLIGRGLPAGERILWFFV